MPLLKKVIEHGDSRCVSLPADWLRHIERESGERLAEVTMEVNGALTIRPFLGKHAAADSASK